MSFKWQAHPLAELPQRMNELDKNKLLIVHCRSGGRSLRAAQLLLASGFTDVKNLSGGILAFASEIDKTMPTY